MSQIIELLAKNKRTALVALFLALLLIAIVGVAHIWKSRKKKES